LIVRGLQSQQQNVRGMVRNIERARTKLGDNIILVEADVTKPETLAAALIGVDTVICAIGATIQMGDTANIEGTSASPESVDYIGTVALIDAAKEAGVSKFVLITSGGVTWWTHPLNWFGDDVLNWKHKSELHLRASGVDHIIVRPAGGLTDEPGGQNNIVFEQRDGIPSSISRQDLATTVINAVNTPAATNKTFEVLEDSDGTLIDDVNWQQTFSEMSVDSDNF
jgi:uncharacterized protein YbjT (DUF2867 family)